jgi:hypothetical protein
MGKVPSADGSGSPAHGSANPGTGSDYREAIATTRQKPDFIALYCAAWDREVFHHAGEIAHFS